MTHEALNRPDTESNMPADVDDLCRVHARPGVRMTNQGKVDAVFLEVRLERARNGHDDLLRWIDSQRSLDPSPGSAAAKPQNRTHRTLDTLSETEIKASVGQAPSSRNSDR